MIEKPMDLANLEPSLGQALRVRGIGLDISLPDGRALHLGVDQATAKVRVLSSRALRNLAALDESGLGDAYVSGELEIEGSLLDVLVCRTSLVERRGPRWLARFVIPTLLGQMLTNRAAIRRHYDLHPEFYLSFLDPTWPAYTHGVYAGPDESLAAATERKFAFAAESCRLAPGRRLLEVGPGWGAYLRYLLPSQVDITALTNSEVSQRYLTSEHSSPLLRVERGDFLSYRTRTPFDAINVMGVLEHLPQYGRVCSQLRDLLVPGGRAYLDASASEKKYAMSGFIYKHVFPYNHSFLDLEGFLAAARAHGLEVVSLHDDSESYRRTIETWARNLESNELLLVSRFGEYHYRRFRLYLWVFVHAFTEGNLQCHRLVLRRPE